MSYDGKFTKQSDAKFSISMDFAQNWLSTGESISSYTVTPTTVSDGAAATSVIDATGNAQSSGVITTYVQAGTSGTDYKLTFKAVSSTTPASTYEADVLMSVRDV